LKTILRLFVASAILLSLCLPLTSCTSSPLVGLWEVTSGDGALFWSPMTIEFKKNGTFARNTGTSEAETGTYKDDGRILVLSYDNGPLQEIKYSYSIIEDVLTINPESKKSVEGQLKRINTNGNKALEGVWESTEESGAKLLYEFRNDGLLVIGNSNMGNVMVYTYNVHKNTFTLTHGASWLNSFSYSFAIKENLTFQPVKYGGETPVTVLKKVSDNTER